jgi:hypothetical protein
MGSGFKLAGLAEQGIALFAVSEFGRFPPVGFRLIVPLLL